MNKAYKIIWSHVRNCYVVVSEIARNHGKNNTKSIVSQLAARCQSLLGGLKLYPPETHMLPPPMDNSLGRRRGRLLPEGSGRLYVPAPRPSGLCCWCWRT